MAGRVQAASFIVAWLKYEFIAARKDKKQHPHELICNEKFYDVFLSFFSRSIFLLDLKKSKSPN